MNEALERKMVDAHVEISFGGWNYNPYPYGSKEYWVRHERDLQDEIKDIEEFIHDHRSRDHYDLHVVRDYKIYCKFCGHEFPDGFNGIADCCEEMMDAQKVNIEYK
jgi:hypothetical protein